jgi:hypothetical protein
LQVLRRAAVEVKKVAKSPVQLLGQPQFQRCVEVETYASHVGQAGIDAGIRENVGGFKAEEINLSSQNRFCAVSCPVNRRRRGVLLAIPIRTSKCSNERVIHITEQMSHGAAIGHAQVEVLLIALQETR